MDFQKIALASIVIIPVGFVIYNFFTQTKEQQLANIKEWLLYACIEAEKQLGSKTGKVKLRYVYDLFISKYRLISMIVSFETFSLWVDEALAQVRNLIETNSAVENYVGGEK